MNPGFRRLKFIYALLALVVVGFSACRERTLISSSLSPASDTVGVRADTLSCITHTFYTDDVITSFNASGAYEYQAIGTLTDSFFGTTTAATFFQITNSGGVTSMATIADHIDSIVLTIPYSNFSYGDTGNLSLTQSYQVFYLDDTIGYNSIYFPYSNKAINIASPLSDPVTVNLHNLKDSVRVAGVNYAPAMRIRLKKNEIYPKLSAAVGAYAASPSSATFVEAFKGICIRPTSLVQFNKVLPYFVLNGSDDYTRAGILVYYHDTASADSAQHLTFSHEQSVCAHFNNVTKSYSRYPINSLFNSTQANDSIVAIQNQPGASIDLKVYGLLSKIPKGVVINKAEIQLSLIAPLNPAKLFPGDQIYPVGVGNGLYPAGTTAGGEYTVLDRFPLSTTSVYSVLDGTPHTINYGTTGITTYTIGIPREVISSIAAGNDTLHYHIRGTQVLYGAYRLLAAGGNYSDYRYKAKLIVVHSSLKK